MLNNDYVFNGQAMSYFDSIPYITKTPLGFGFVDPDRASNQLSHIKRANRWRHALYYAQTPLVIRTSIIPYKNSDALGYNTITFEFTGSLESALVEVYRVLPDLGLYLAARYQDGMQTMSFIKSPFAAYIFVTKGQ